MGAPAIGRSVVTHSILPWAPIGAGPALGPTAYEAGQDGEGYVGGLWSSLLA